MDNKLIFGLLAGGAAAYYLFVYKKATPAGSSDDSGGGGGGGGTFAAPAYIMQPPILPRGVTGSRVSAAAAQGLTAGSTGRASIPNPVSQGLVGNAPSTPPPVVGSHVSVQTGGSGGGSMGSGGISGMDGSYEGFTGNFKTGIWDNEGDQ